MKYLITGGGTGGHIYPALSIAQKIVQNEPNAQILYVGTKKGMEAEIVPKHGFEYKTVRVKFFKRKLSLDTVVTVKELMLGIKDSRKIIKEFKPDLVIGTGGFVCGPVVLAASLMKIPTLIHEQNAFPGVTNKLLSKFTDSVAASFEESFKYFKYQDKVTLTGNPIRDIFNTINKEEAQKVINASDKTTIFSFGGSGGQKSINDSILDMMELNKDNDDLRFIHVTGKRLKNSFKEGFEKRNLKDSKSEIEIMEYNDKMAETMAISDIVVTSAGAITIAEVTAVGIPSIIIPKAYTAENHQEYNARALENKGACKMILEKELTGEKLNEEVSKIVNDEGVHKKMSENAKKAANREAINKIYELVKGLV